MAGILYIVATPIGNLEDITYRAVSILNQVDLIAAEDTRHSQRLLQAYAIQTPLISLHEHNERARGEELIQQLEQGKSIALISDAGTPLISDPGYHLVRLAHDRGVTVSPIPGCCAAIAALSASGLKSDSFIFEGFLPAKSTERLNFLAKFKEELRTIIFYETPHRIVAALKDLQQTLGDRRMIIAREMTKKFETIKSGSILEVLAWTSQKNEHQKGEFVLIIEGCEKQKESVCDEKTLRLLDGLLSELSLNQAVKLASKISGTKKNTLYEIALARQNK